MLHLFFRPPQRLDVCLFVAATYIIIKELHNKCGHAAVNADKEVDAGQYHIGRAGHTEDEGGGVHHRGDGPPAENNTLLHRQIREASDLIQTEPRKKVTVAKMICTKLNHQVSCDRINHTLCHQLLKPGHLRFINKDYWFICTVP